jgi:hypothetical protein
MKTLILAPSFWLRASLLSVSALVLTVVIASVCVQSLRSSQQPCSLPGPEFQMDESTFRQAIQVDKLYQGIPDFGDRS